VIADYERRHWEIEAPDAPDLLREQMEIKGLKASDLAALLGSKARACEVLNRRRHLTQEQAWTLHKEWRLPTDALIRPYPLRSAILTAPPTNTAPTRNLDRFERDDADGRGKKPRRRATLTPP
jgi:hypothetical protein